MSWGTRGDSCAALPSRPHAGAQGGSAGPAPLSHYRIKSQQIIREFLPCLTPTATTHTGIALLGDLEQF
jgi:hypothetical protein